MRRLLPCGFSAATWASGFAPPQESFANKAAGAFADALIPVVRRNRLRGRGSLLLSAVDQPELCFISDPRQACDTLWKPGSTLKPFLLKHLLERGLLSAGEEHLCPGGALPFAGRRLDCSHAPQPGPLDPSTALALSCNRCFLFWAERLLSPGHRASFTNALRLAGFSKRQWFGLQTAAAWVSSPSTRESILLQALGESDVVTTPLGMLGVYQSLLRRMRAEKESKGAAEIAANTLLAAMHTCIRAGTGVEAQAPGLDLGGKTGTGTSPDRHSLHGWMVSYWPAGAPRLLMVVCTEHGRGGSEAAPIAGDGWAALHRAGLLG